MKVNMYIGVDANSLKNMQTHGVFATSLLMALYGNDRRFNFTVSLPDEAIYGNVGYAPITEQEEVIA